MGPDKDKLLSHEADGIREFDNALPRWWLYGFYFTIVFGVAYFANYHLLATPIVGASTIAAEYTAEMRAAAAVVRSADASAAVLVARTDVVTLKKGEEIFMSARSLCHTCHRPDLGGLIGPNLTDDRWLHGCTATEMVKNVRTGFPAKGMLPYGSGQQLTDDDVLAVVSFVLSKRGTQPNNPKATEPERDKECR